MGFIECLRIYDDGPDISLCEYNSKGLLKKHTLIDAEDNVIHMQCFNYKKGKLNSKTLNDGDYKWITRYYYKNGKLNYISKKSGTEVREEMTYDSKGNLIKKRSIRNMNLKKKSFDWAPISTCTYMYDMNNNILEERDCKFRMLCSIYKYEYNKMQFLVKMSQFIEHGKKQSQYIYKYEENGLRKERRYGLDFDSPEMVDTYEYDFY
jgi:hypothetical protein